VSDCAKNTSVNVLDQRSCAGGGSELGPSWSNDQRADHASLSVASDAQCASPSFRVAATQLTVPVIAVVGRM
jgi:hypothetical protein